MPAGERHREARRVRGGDQLFGTGHALGVVGRTAREIDVEGRHSTADEFDSSGSVLESAGPR